MLIALAMADDDDEKKPVAAPANAKPVIAMILAALCNAGSFGG